MISPHLTEEFQVNPIREVITIMVGSKGHGYLLETICNMQQLTDLYNIIILSNLNLMHLF